MGPDGSPVIKGPFPEPAPDRSGQESETSSGTGDAVLLHLSGPHRGTRQHLTGSEALVGTTRHAIVHFPVGSDPAVASHHAVLMRGAGGWSVQEEDGQVYLNSADVPGLHGRETLVPGDILEIGSGGPVIRFLMETRAPPPYKSMGDTLRDCVDCARHGGERFPARLAVFLRSLPRELFTRTAPRTRFLVAGLLLLLIASVGTLTAYGLRLERRIEEEERRSLGVAEALSALTDLPAGDPELRALVGDLEDVLLQRIEALEALSEAGRRVVTTASSSVVFMQGGYQFIDPDSERVLRLRLDLSGEPRMGPGGMPLTTFEGDGPPFEAQFTGSAWLVSDDGLLVTNRHIALPWNANPRVRQFLDRDLRPRLALLAYIPGESEPVDVEFVTASEESDLAIVRAPDLAGRLSALPLAAASPVPGQTILVLGYPAGINALLARSGAMFVDSLMQRRPDFWDVVRGLSEAGFIRPLATRGIVGQVTPSTVAYDAETTRGGSGGPVMSLDGKVVAVTFAVLAEFGGSNLGVPVEEVRRLLANIAEDEAAP
jgi:S1-C subfamily serine protease